MSPAHVLEPTYDAIKHRLKVGVWPSGFRLEAARLAADLGVSITPVRDSLHLLAGERLVEMMPGAGFRVPSPSEQDLRDIFDFNLFVLLGAIKASGRPLVTPPAEADNASAVASLFLGLVLPSGSSAMIATIQSHNDRLHRFRRLDEALLAGSAADLVELNAAFCAPEWRSIAPKLLTGYHTVRKLNVSRYLATLAGHGGR